MRVMQKAIALLLSAALIFCPNGFVRADTLAPRSSISIDAQKAEALNRFLEAARREGTYSAERYQQWRDMRQAMAVMLGRPDLIIGYKPMSREKEIYIFKPDGKGGLALMETWTPDVEQKGIVAVPGYRCVTQIPKSESAKVLDLMNQEMIELYAPIAQGNVSLSAPTPSPASSSVNVPVELATFFVGQGEVQSGTLRLSQPTPPVFLANTLRISGEEQELKWKMFFYGIVDSVAEDVKRLRAAYPWLQAFQDVCQIKIVYGPAQGLPRLDEDGSLLLPLDLFLDRSVETGSEKASWKRTQEVVRRSVLLHAQLRENRLFDTLLRKVVPETEAKPALRSALKEIYARRFEFDYLSSAMSREPQVRDILQHPAYGIQIPRLEELMAADSEDRILEIIQNLSESPGTAHSAEIHEGLKELGKDAAAHALVSGGWQAMKAATDSAQHLVEACGAVQISLKHFLNQPIYIIFGNAEELPQNAQTDFRMEYGKIFRNLDELFARVRALEKIDPNAYLLRYATGGWYFEYNEAIWKKVPEEQRRFISDFYRNTLQDLASAYESDFFEVSRWRSKKSEWDAILKQHEELSQNTSPDANAIEQKRIVDQKMEEILAGLKALGKAVEKLSKRISEGEKKGALVLRVREEPDVPLHPLRLVMTHAPTHMSFGADLPLFKKEALLRPSFSVARGKTTSEDEDAQTIARVDRYARDASGLGRDAEIFYRIQDNAVPLVQLRREENSDGLTIELSASLLHGVRGNGRLLCALKRAHRQRMIMQENLLRGVPTHLIGPLSQALVTLAEISDAWANGSIKDLITEHNSAQQSGAQELLKYAQRVPFLDAALLKRLVTTTGQYSAEVLALMNDPAFLARTYFPLLGIRNNVWEDKHRDFFARFVDDDLWGPQVPAELLPGKATHEVGVALQHLAHGSLSAALGQVAMAKGNQVDRKTALENLRKCLEDIRVIYRNMRDVKNFKSIPYARTSRMLDIMGDDSKVTPVKLSPEQEARLVTKLGIVKDIVDFMEPNVQAVDEAFASWEQSPESDDALNAMQAALSQYESFSKRLVGDKAVFTAVSPRAMSAGKPGPLPTAVPIVRVWPEGAPREEETVFSKIKWKEEAGQWELLSGDFMWWTGRSAAPKDYLIPGSQRPLSERMKLMQAIRSLLQKQDIRYRTMTAKIRFAVVENGPTLLHIHKEEDLYEVRIDKALMNLADKMNVFPLAVLLLNHELNHALLRERRAAEGYYPIVEESAINGVDLFTFAKFGQRNQALVMEALDRLKANNFATDPYREFLESHARYLFSKGRSYFIKKVGRFFLRLVEVSTHPIANPAYHERLNVMESLDEFGTRRKIDFANTLAQQQYTGVAQGLFNAEKQGELLYVLFDELKEALAQPLSVFDKHLDGLFKDFELENYRKNYLDSKGKPIRTHDLDERLRSIAKIGDRGALPRLEEMLGATDYHPEHRIKMAECVLAITAPDGSAAVRNPYFIRELINYSKQLRADTKRHFSSLAFDDERMRTWKMLLELLGDARAETNTLNLEIRSELAACGAAFAQAGREVWAYFESEGKKEIVGEDVDRLEKVYDLLNTSEQMLNLGHENLLAYLGKAALSEGEWDAKFRLHPRPGDPTFQKIAVGELDEKRYEAMMARINGETAPAVLSRFAMSQMIRKIKAGTVLREAIYMGYGKIIDESQIEKIDIMYLGKGDEKVVYRLRVKMKDSEEVFEVVANIAKAMPRLPSEREPISETTFSGFFDELHRLMGPTYETLLAYRTEIPVLFWFEAYVPGLPLHQLEDPKAMTVFSRKQIKGPKGKTAKQDEPIGEWQRRVTNVIREYSRTCWKAWDDEGRLHTGIDVWMRNFIRPRDGDMCIVDAGIRQDMKHASPEQQNRPPEYLLLILANAMLVLDREPELGLIKKMPEMPEHDTALEYAYLSRLKDVGERKAGEEMARIHISERFKDMPGPIARAVYDGVLDALGEADGLKVLEAIHASFQSKASGASKLDQTPNSLTEYLRREKMNYVPLQALATIPELDEQRLEKDPNLLRDSRLAYFHDQELHDLRNSPWLWAYVCREYVQSYPIDPGRRSQWFRLLGGLTEVVDKIREHPEYLEEKNRALTADWVKEIIGRFTLDEVHAQYLREAVHYQDALATRLDERMNESLNENGFDARDFAAPRQDLIRLAVAVNTDPERAAELFHDQLHRPTDDPLFAFLFAMHHAKGEWQLLLAQDESQENARIQAELAKESSPDARERKGRRLEKSKLERIQKIRRKRNQALLEQELRTLTDAKFIHEESFVQMWRKLTPEDLMPFLGQIYYHDLFQHFVHLDYKRFAKGFSSLIRPGEDSDEDHAAALAHFVFQEHGLGNRGVAYLLNEFDRATQGKWLNAILQWYRVDGHWNEKLRAQGFATNGEMSAQIIQRTIGIMNKFHGIAPAHAGDLIASVLRRMTGGVVKQNSYLNKLELVDRDGRRIETLMDFLQGLPHDIWDAALRSLASKNPSQTGQAMAVYLETLLAVERDRYGQVRPASIDRLLASLQRLALSHPLAANAVAESWLAMADIPEQVIAYALRRLSDADVLKVFRKLSGPKSPIRRRRVEEILALRDDALRMRMINLLDKMHPVSEQLAPLKVYRSLLLDEAFNRAFTRSLGFVSAPRRAAFVTEHILMLHRAMDLASDNDANTWEPLRRRFLELFTVLGDKGRQIPNFKGNGLQAEFSNTWPKAALLAQMLELGVVKKKDVLGNQAMPGEMRAQFHTFLAVIQRRRWDFSMIGALANAPQDMQGALLLIPYEEFAKDFFRLQGDAFPAMMNQWAQRVSARLDDMIGRLGNSPDKTQALAEDAKAFDRHALEQCAEKSSVLRLFLTLEQIRELKTILGIGAVPTAPAVPAKIRQLVPRAPDTPNAGPESQAA